MADTDYITVASTGDGTDFGDLDEPSSYGQRNGASNGTLLFSNGGLNATYAHLNRMEYYTIASTGNGTDAGNLSGTKTSPSATNGDSRYLVVGGFKAGSAITDDNEYNDFSTSANVSDFGNLSAEGVYMSTANSTTRAVLQWNNYAVSDTLEYVTVASTGDSSDFGDLDTARSELCGSSDGVTGEFYGGDSTTSNDRMDSIEKITIASTGNGSDVGDLLEVNELAGATSGR